MKSLAKKRRIDELFDDEYVGWIFSKFNYTRLAKKSSKYKDCLSIGIRQNVLISFSNLFYTRDKTQ